MQNVEIKTSLPDPAGTESRARALGARLQWTRRQRDVFFRVPSGYLKLRVETAGAEAGFADGHGVAATAVTGRAVGAPEADRTVEARAELIAYLRAPGADPRPSDYDIAPVSDPAALETALARALGRRGVVEKTRRLFLWRHTRIHFDEVAGLGAFLELETVVKDISLEAAQAEAREVIAALGLDPALFLDRPYLELLEERGG